MMIMRIFLKLAEVGIRSGAVPAMVVVKKISPAIG
jgi:hypothetical protein